MATALGEPGPASLGVSPASSTRAAGAQCAASSSTEPSQAHPPALAWCKNRSRKGFLTHSKCSLERLGAQAAEDQHAAPWTAAHTQVFVIRLVVHGQDQFQQALPGQ